MKNSILRGLRLDSKDSKDSKGSNVSKALGRLTRRLREWRVTYAQHTLKLKYAAVLVLLCTVGIGNAWGAEVVAYTLTPANGSNNDYTKNCDITISEITWNLEGNSQIQPWRIGGAKNTSGTNTKRSIYSKTAISSNISKVTITHGSKSNITVNSVTLRVYSTAAKASEGNDADISNVSVSYVDNGTMTFNRPSEVSWAGRFFRIDYDLTWTSSNAAKYIIFTNAQFYKNTYTVTYNANSGSGTLTDSNSPYDEGSTVTVKSNTFTKSGFDFTGWNTASGGSGTSYAAGNTFTISANTTLYAQWVAAASCSNEITITKGTPSNGSFSLSQTGAVCIDDDNATIAVTGITPSPGYRFKEITSSGSGTINNTAKTVTNISANTTINVVFEQIPSHKAYFYNGSTLLNTGGTSFQEGAAVSYGGSTPVSCDTGESASNTFVGWATAEWDGKVAKNAIVPDLYESTLPVMGDEDVTYYAVFAKVSSASELFSWVGGGSEALKGTTGVTADGLGRDYAEGNAPYLVKLDNTDDYIIIETSAAIGSVAIGVKMIGGPNTSTLTVQESTASDGTFTDVEALSISGSQNDVLDLSTSNAFNSASRAVKLLFTKGSNVGVGPITITGVPSASNYMTSCAACAADPTVGVAQLNGPFDLDRVGVTVTGSSAGTNCAWTDYGFVWGTSANPTVSNNKVQVGTSGTATTWDGDLTGTFSTGTTYYYRAYGKNGKDGATYQYSDDATFTPRSVTFNLKGHGSSAPSTQYVNDGGKASDPSYSEDVDYWSFEGWYSNSDCTGSAWDFSTNTVSGDNVTLYAKWVEASQYTVKWYVNGSVAHSQTGYEGTTLTSIPTPTSSDCDGSKVFVGWTNAEYSDDDTAPDFYSPTTIPNGGANYYAVFADEGEGGTDWELVTSSSDAFADGDNIIIASSGSAGSAYALGYQKDNNRDAESITIASGPMIVSPTFATETTDQDKIYPLKLEANGAYWNIKDLVNNKYLGATGTKNNLLKLGDDKNANSRKFSLSVNASGEATIVGQQTGNNNYLRFNSNDKLFTCYSSSTQNSVYIYRRNYSYSNYSTTCCQQPTKPLSMTADKTELVRSGTVNFTLTGGNGKGITWSCRDESDANCDALLGSTSNSGATLTISSPVATTKTYTVKAVQPENDDDTEVVCGKTVSIDITVKTEWTITFKTTNYGTLTTHSTTTVTDGETYTFPDLSDEYTCETNYSFAGWKAANTDGAPEHEAGSSAKATENTTWYAVWMYSAETTTITRDKYVRLTNGSSVAENDVVVIAYANGGVALAQMDDEDEYGSPVAVDFADDKSYLTFASGTSVMELKLQNQAEDDDDHYAGWYFLDNNNTSRGITYTGEGGSLLWYENDYWTWDIVITAQNNATISDVEDGYTSFSLQYNSSKNKFAFYSSSQKKVQLYRKNGTVSIEVPATPTYSVNNVHCTNGATIRANGGQWVTSAKDQKVRIIVPVTAKNFETSGKQITGSSDNEHFAVSVASHTIPSDKSESSPIDVIIEYTPAAANVIETANITLTTGTGAGDATKVIEVNGRSLPEEFVIMTQKEGKWQALPANMFNGTGTYSPIEVTPNVGLTLIPSAPYTTIYSASAVANGRYGTAGECVRLVGNNNKCLWANSSTDGTGIQNYAALGSSNGAAYEWLLSTTDGETYTIANPAHPDYATGRQLGIYSFKYGLYKTSDIFYLLPVGCSSLPGNIQIAPHRTDATFSWETNAASVTIDLWTNEAMSEGHKQAVVTSVPYQFTGLEESTDYWYKITPGSDDDCAVTGSFSTTGPIIDIVEWGENSATIYVDKDEAVDPRIIIAGEVEHGQGGTAATDIFFSKYFEAEGTAKMLAVFNGTGNAISLADITILQRSSTQNTPLSLASFGKTAGWIQPGEEIILFNKDPRAAVMSCAESDPTYPSWNNVEDGNLAFSGKGTIRLFRGNKCIDIIGAMEDAEDDIDDKSVKPMEGSTSSSWGDDKGFVVDNGDDYSTKGVIETNYGLSTNRCLLIRQNWVTSGDSAVLNNYGSFKTLGGYTGVDSKTHKGEWAGLHVPNAVAPETDYIHTCEGFQEVGKFDYNKYYRDYTKIGDDKYLSDFTRAADGTYILPIAYMRQYACLNLKFQLTEHDNADKVLTEQLVQVPIVVKDARNTNDTLFNNIIKEDDAPHDPMIPESIERCKTCNVVILGTGALTKAADGSSDDVPQIGNLKIYPGGQLVVPSATNYTINTLSFRREGEDIPLADIQGGLSIGQSNGVYLDLRIDHNDWHYVALPYDCRLSDVTFSDGTIATLNTDYFVAAYDGAQRAATKKTQWIDIMDDEYVLKKGIGHIIALSGSGNDKRELRFPMANNVIDEETADTKTVSGVYGYGADKTDEELRPNHKGWNMVGNPYFKYFSPEDLTTPLATGELVHSPVVPWDGTWVIEEGTSSLRYVVRPIDNGWSGYEQVLIGSTKMEPFTAYFVQIGITGEQTPETEQTVIFNKSKLSTSAPVRRRIMAEEQENMYPVWYGIELIAPNTEKDRTALLISNEFTDGYDMMNDLAKQRGDYYTYYNKPVLASRNNEGEMVFNALPDSSAATIGVPLNYYAAQAGTYTIATDSRYDLEEVKSAMLYDAANNTYTDLLTENYSFTANKGNNTERFTLYVRVERKKTPNVETGTDNILDGKLSLVSIAKTLVLSGLTDAADVYVYDMSGKLMNSAHTSGDGGIWRTTVPATGVYFVRVNSADGQQTLRAIVK